MTTPVFEILEHTADIGIRAFGSTLPELFENAALAVESIAFDLSGVEPRIACLVSATGDDRTSLFVNWLNEVIYQFDALQIAIARLHWLRFTDTAISARGWGEARDPRRHAPRMVVKAATYHQVSIRQVRGRWIAEVYLDI